MQAGYKTDRGRKRHLNEDAVMVHQFDAAFHSGIESAALFVVADGMGGHNAGEVASKLGITIFVSECIRQLIGQSATVDLTSFNEMSARDIFDQAVKIANDAVSQKAKEQGLQGMGTTIVAALVVGQFMYVTNVGDSRCYIINSQEIRQLTRVTKDHSLVQEMVDAGMITPEQASLHPRRNEITRAIGAYAGITGDFYYCRLYEGDVMLLCSDGLSGVVDEQKMAEAVLATNSPDQACADLVAMANEAGGPDNITVIVAKPEHVPSLDDVMSVNTEIRQISSASI